ncbi:LuxR C-terminal-related transcriptional regulator [Amycolatopsis sp. Poz14]|uniref:ATP-binding protein n=1 Tax=Amycolatopsis sp. Poz14 TaxID=1447705 RepID=UPI001EE8DCC2|nr:LuxR C-terminal-related transcriptional regulator [Amycolatopsis sp. Poz14]MCG3751984.1 AAA family ATPase [Amycolatopsis sp. Poz14]
MAAKPNTVPADLTTFVGRRQEVAAVRQLLTAARLVTLTGIGGVGKTRLATTVAADVRRAFPDGTCLVELASLKDPALLPHTVADALGISEQSTRSAAEVVCGHLRERRMLLVLDNCEHLVDAAAELTDQVLRAAPHVRVLATSRQALRLAGEHVFPVPPLPVPEPGEPMEPGTATRFPAVALFADRSAAAVPGFELTPANEQAVVRLCRRLEGIPLAIELAAVRLRVLTVDDLERRLDDRFQLLREGNRNDPERHRTLQSLVDWSYELCTPGEQALWARASVFAGGFDTGALEAVCADEAVPADDVLDTVAGLLDKSVFIREERGGHARFRMLETLREYGQARLAETGAEPEVHRRHRDYYSELMEQAGTQWYGPRQLEWADRLRDEHANLRRAFEHCLSEPADAGRALRMAGMVWFWLAMDHITEGRLWLERVLPLCPEPTRERAWGLATASYLDSARGEEAGATRSAQSAVDLAAALDDPAALAYAKHVLAATRYLHSDLSEAIVLFEQSLAQYEKADVEPQYPDLMRTEMASMLVLSGQLDQAAKMLEELLARGEQTGEQWQLSYVLWVRGLSTVLAGKPEQAGADFAEALRTKRSFHDTLGLALAVDALAWVRAAEGDGDRSAALFGGAAALWGPLGSPLFGSVHLTELHETFLRMAREQLGENEFQAAYDRGRAMPPDAVFALALGEQPPASQTGRKQPSVLTKREREVAGLVADGLTNRDIAARLVLSPRTVDGHVEKALTKLGFTTRTQIANWIAQQRKDAS